MMVLCGSCTEYRTHDSLHRTVSYHMMILHMLPRALDYLRAHTVIVRP